MDLAATREEENDSAGIRRRTQGPTGFRAVHAVHAVRLCSVVAAELGQQGLGRGAGQGLSHLRPESHGIPASMFCAESHSEEQTERSVSLTLS